MPQLTAIVRLQISIPSVYKFFIGKNKKDYKVSPTKVLSLTGSAAFGRDPMIIFDSMELLWIG